MSDFGSILLVLFCLSLYLLPTIVGWRKRNITAIFVVNLFAGWTILGWFIAFVWALTRDPEKTIINNYQAPVAPPHELDLLERMRSSGKITNDEYWEERKRIGI